MQCQQTAKNANDSGIPEYITHQTNKMTDLLGWLKVLLA